MPQPEEDKALMEIKKKLNMSKFIKTKTTVILFSITAVIAALIFISNQIIRNRFDLQWITNHRNPQEVIFNKKYEFDERLEMMHLYKEKIKTSDYKELIDSLINSKDVDNLMLATMITSEYYYYEYLSEIDVGLEIQEDYLDNWYASDSIWQFPYTKEYCRQKLKSIAIIKNEAISNCERKQ